MGSVVPLFIPEVPLQAGHYLNVPHHVNLSAVVFGSVCMLFFLV